MTPKQQGSTEIWATALSAQRPHSHNPHFRTRTCTENTLWGPPSFLPQSQARVCTHTLVPGELEASAGLGDETGRGIHSLSEGTVDEDPLRVGG